MSSRQKRTFVGNHNHHRRNIEKVQINLNRSTTGVTQTVGLLFNSSVPVTITGLHWDLAFSTLTGPASGNTTGRWALVISRESLTASTMSTSDLSIPYIPEENAMIVGIFDAGVPSGARPSDHFVGSTKTQRKLKCGDSLNFLMKGDSADQVAVCMGVITFFTKF